MLIIVYLSLMTKVRISTYLKDAGCRFSDIPTKLSSSSLDRLAFPKGLCTKLSFCVVGICNMAPIHISTGSYCTSVWL